MSTPILNPDSSSTIKTNPSSTSSLSYFQSELGKILLHHDPSAIRLYDFLNQVRVFRYNSTKLRWENRPYLEGNLFAYQKHQTVNHQKYSSFAFAVINPGKHFIQDICSNMSKQVNDSRLFYEITKDNKCEVFCLHFLNENDCQRLHTFIEQSIQPQSRATITSEQQSHLTVQQSTPMINVNSNTQDPTSSLKRLLNIPNDMDNAFDLPQQQSLNLLPPSAFQSLSHERDIQHTREHIRHALFDLIQNNDQFLDIIVQACYNYQWP